MTRVASIGVSSPSLTAVNRLPAASDASKALEGDSVALRLCMERIAPAPKDQPVSFRLPKMKNALDASEAAGNVLTAVSEGELTPIEATRVMGLIDSYRRTLELTEIEARLQALEIQSVP